MFYIYYFYEPTLHMPVRCRCAALTTEVATVVSFVDEFFSTL